MITYEEIDYLIDYDPKSGKLKWSDNHRTLAGKKVGSLNGGGYVELQCKRWRLYGHRVAWCLTHKEWPKGQLDHINGVRDDNRIENLRAVTNKENHKNMKRHKDSTSGVTGVYWNKRAKKWQAYICVSSKQLYLGVFKYLVDAETARKEAEVKYGYHKNHGRF